MLILRILLYLICISSIFWSALIFIGPTVVKRLVSAYSNGTVTPSDISISPALDINIGRLDYNFSDVSPEMPILGFSRSTELVWSLSEEKPFLKVDFGPTFLKDIATVDAVKFSTAPLYKVNWKNFFIDSEISDLKLESFGQVEKLNLQWNVNNWSAKINNLKFEAKMINTDDSAASWFASSVSGSLEDLDVTKSIQSQLLTGDFSAIDIGIRNPHLDLFKAHAAIRVSGDYQNFKIDLKDISFPELPGAIANIKIGGSYNMEKGFDGLRVDFFNGNIAHRSVGFSTIFTEIKRFDSNRYDVFASGELNEFEIYSAKNFIGIFPPLNFSINSEIDGVNSKITAKSHISFESLDVSGINGSADMAFGLGRLPNILRCELEDCELNNFDLKYKINVSSDWIKGRSSCLTDSCNLNSLSHSLMTSNTTNIFATLNKSGILNPLSSLYLFSMISSGQKINMGHELNF